MANKVLSIKMDEKDLDKLRRYYDILVNLGFISNETLKMNGFLKHLLLDNLAYDFSTMLDMYSELGMEPQYINPQVIDKDEFIKISNIYSLDENAFQLYKDCYKEIFSNSINKLEECTEELMKITGLDMIVEGGHFHKIMTIPDEDMDSCQKFWGNKAFEQDKIYKEDSNKNAVERDVEMIMQSNLPEEAKLRLVEQIRQYDRDKKNNLLLLEGKGYQQG